MLLTIATAIRYFLLVRVAHDAFWPLVCLFVRLAPALNSKTKKRQKT